MIYIREKWEDESSRDLWNIEWYTRSWEWEKMEVYYDGSLICHSRTAYDAHEAHISSSQHDESVFASVYSSLRSFECGQRNGENAKANKKSEKK